MSKKIRIKIDRNACSGCLSCMTTCSMVHESYASLSAARVQIGLRPFDGPHEITLCRQCTQASCQEACPEGAIVRDTGGFLVVDYDRCTGCQACIEACPFGAMFWNPISEKVIKCELCRAEPLYPGDPQCVQACPTGALTIQIMPDKKTRRKRGEGQ